MTELDPTATDVQPPEGQGEPTATTAPSEVQPDQGQGQQDDTTGLYDLSSVPEEFREHVERIAKDIDRNAQAKFREAADYRKQWAPYEELGLNQVEAEQLAPILDLAKTLGGEDGEAAQRLVLELAKSVGLEVEGLDDEPAIDDDPLSPLEQRLAALEQEREQAIEAQRAQEATQRELERLTAEWTQVEEEHKRQFGEGFDEKQTELLASLVERFGDDEEPVKAAYALMNQIAGMSEQRLVKSQSKAPKPAEPAGRASTAVSPPQTFEEAEALFRERLSQSNAA